MNCLLEARKAQEQQQQPQQQRQLARDERRISAELHVSQFASGIEHNPTFTARQLTRHSDGLLYAAVTVLRR